MSADYDHRGLSSGSPLSGPPVFTIGRRRTQRRHIRWVQLTWIEIQPDLPIPKTSGIPTPN